MVQDERHRASMVEDDPDQLSMMLDVLGNTLSRKLFWQLVEADQSVNARELANAGDAALATVYRKLNQLTEAGLVAEHKEVDPDGHRRSRFEPSIDKIEITIGKDDSVELRLTKR